MPNFYDPKRDESNDATFNMALAYLERLNKLLNLACESSLTGDLKTWFSSLQSLHREISPKLKDNENKTFLDEFARLSPIANAFESARQRRLSGEKVRLGNELLPSLILLDIKIKKHMDTAKFLMPKSDDPRYALGGGR